MRRTASAASLFALGSLVTTSRCPACHDPGIVEVISWPSVPSNSALFFPTREEALSHPNGSIRLTRCERCGFLFNADLDPQLTDYSTYVETQSHSEHHSVFARSLAADWIGRYGLAGKSVLEIGPENGAAFLGMFCELSGGRGIAMGPSVGTEPPSPRVSLVSDLFDDRSVDVPADAVICRHTLEHISDVRSFLASLRRWADRHPTAVHLFELPDAQRILDEVAFWDVYYEHCSYFTTETLATTFEEAGFLVERCGLVYDDQYIVLEARPAAHPGLVDERALASHAAHIAQASDRFVADLTTATQRLSSNLTRLAADGPVLLWQAGSKATSIFRVPGADELVEAIVDINPDKRGLYLVGSGHRIIGVDDVADYKPRHVVMMNPVYEAEIAALLRMHGVDTGLHSAYDLTLEEIGSLTGHRRAGRLVG